MHNKGEQSMKVTRKQTRRFSKILGVSHMTSHFLIYAMRSLALFF